MGSVPGLKRSPGGRHGNPLQHSCLENPTDRGAWKATVHGVAKESDTTKVRKHTQYIHILYSHTSSEDHWPEDYGSFLSPPQSCPTLYNPIEGSPLGSSVHGILQARILEWVAMPFSRGSARLRNRTCVSYISCFGSRVLNH